MYLKILYWFPRSLAILAILFMMMFSLDAFGGEQSFGRQLSGFLIHNIPAFILIIALVIAWKYEIIGGTIFIIMFFVLGIFFKSFTVNTGSLILLIPFLLTGFLLILHQLLVEQNREKLP
ncbi:MAG: hypothetical protein JXN62_04695 [Bacteroidales bacterium]|nr:hypothetical protein [Bacteroidales bacterium]